jgi:general secretion pathway protein D
MRSRAVKPSAKLLTGCVTLMSTLWGTTAWAGPPSLAHPALIASAATSQPADSPADKRRESDLWLQRARQAMKEGKVELAQDYLVRAEKTGAVYETIFARFVDTPEKVRKDLDAMRARSGQANANAGRPSDRFQPAPLAGADLQQRSAQGQPSAPPNPNFDPAEKLAGSAQADAAASLERGNRSGFLMPPPGPNGAPGNGPGAPERDSQVDRLLAPRSGGSFAAPAAGDLARLPDSPVAEGTVGAGAKAECLRLVAQAQAALDRGDAAQAQQLITQAKRLQVPDEAFQPGETHPAIVGLQVERALARRGGGYPNTAVPGPQNVRPASAIMPAGGEAAEPGQRFPVSQGIYNPGEDRTRTVRVQAEEPTPAQLAPSATLADSRGVQLYQEGVQALERQDREGALRAFREAWKSAGELDPVTRAALKDKLSLLQEIAPPAPGAAPTPGREPSALEAVDARQQLLRQQLFREITTEQDTAKRMIATDPKAALTRLQRLRDRVAESELDPPSRKQLLTVVDRNLNELEKFIEQNRSDIENNDRNRDVMDKVERDRSMKLDTQDKIAELVEQFNELMDERRYPEAEMLARQARELDPENPVTQTLSWKAKFAIRIAEQNGIKDEKEEGFYAAMTSVDRASKPFNDENPILFQDPKDWSALTQGRRKMMEQQRRRLSPAEQEIQKSLAKPVEVRFNNRPLKEVLETLGAAANINIHLDNAGLAAEGVTSDTPVSINLTQPISLRSALNLILEQLRLSFVIQNEVLKVTSEQTRDADVYTRVYDVADLVIPIPNFTPGYNTGLPAAIMEAHRAIGYGGFVAPNGSGPLTLASNQPTATGGSVLAQMGAGGMLPGMRGPQSLGSGPGGLGGGAQADFDSLIELVTTTVAPASWTEVGGPGSIEAFPTNLSIVVSTTQEVHDQIADLLEQLRRLQDLQVTIEVRFITLRDNFFERMGVDFDFRIDDNTGLNEGNGLYPDDIGPSYVVGLNNVTNAPTADLDIPFTQDSFTSTVPQFGGFDVNTAANFGFAILSDIEVFLLLQAAQGDSRSNVLQAPKVTLFNGQQASVSDTSQRPFVTSIIPVVGDFAAAHQPVIVVLNEGTSLSVQAVVSADRRFVRLTLVPFFSRIGDVQEFTFSGKTTTKSGTNVKDPTDDTATVQDGVETTTEGTTVQLPTFAFTTVTTTVSVPDGGTVLLGGIKRLNEARSERGVPMLNKIPYVNRLFKNVGIGRETQSLMLMVTPRIIIQEEEERKLGIDLGS